MYPGQHPPDRIAYRMADSAEAITYGELEAASNQAAHLYRERGLTPGDGIAILLGNEPDYLKIVWGAQRSGLYFTPISVLFSAAEIEYIVDNSDAKLLITRTAFADGIDLTAFDADVLLLDGDDPATNWFGQAGTQLTEPIADETEGAEMVYSSGTTGKPKGVRFPLSGAELGTIPKLFQTRIKMHAMTEATRYLSTAPLYHSAPLRYNLLVTRLGGTSVIMPKFDAETALRMIETHGITHSQWVPTMFVRMLRLPEATRLAYDLSSHRYAIHAAAPCPVTVKRAMLDWWGPVVYEYYSGTEANGSTAITPEEWTRHQGSVGRAIHGEIHILDDDDNELPNGEIGRVFFANGTDFHYHKDPDKTAAAKTAEGWSTLGDIGYVDDEGYLYLRDRTSFMIISGGVNIYPQETENVLISHPRVADVAVIGVPNDEFGEEVKAVVELVSHADASDALAAELIGWCRERISHVKCPRSIDFTEALPRHPTGKLYKHKLRESYWEGHESRII